MQAMYAVRRSCALILILAFAIFTAQAQQEKDKTANTGRGVIVGKDGAAYKAASPGEPVPGAEIYIELETDDLAVAKGKSDHLGTYHFRNIKRTTCRVACVIDSGFTSRRTLGDYARVMRAIDSSRLFVEIHIQTGAAKNKTTIWRGRGSKSANNPLKFISPPIVLKNATNSLTVSVALVP